MRKQGIRGALSGSASRPSAVSAGAVVESEPSGTTTGSNAYGGLAGSTGASQRSDRGRMTSIRSCSGCLRPGSAVVRDLVVLRPKGNESSSHLREFSFARLCP